MYRGTINSITQISQQVTPLIALLGGRPAGLLVDPLVVTLWSLKAVASNSQTII